MYFLAHLLAGILLGALLTYLFRDTRLIPACAFGSILPDLIDKPVGLILLADTIGYARIYGHTLLFAGLILFIGLGVALKYPRTGILISGLAAGVLLHQALDAMWFEPITWYWPALGPFKGHARPDFFYDAFMRTIRNPTEWLAGGIILAFLVISCIPRYRERFLSATDGFGLRDLSLPLLLLIVGIVALVVIIAVEYR